jgi:hypothetical protein
MSARAYRLTEEVARQAVEVIFGRTSDWFVCFSNPTAGPWKLIKLMTPGGPKEVARFLKEDVRPDVILQHLNAGIFILLEAKDDAQKLLNAAQAKKSLRMFEAEIRRLEGLVGERKGKYTFLTGFLYPSQNPARDLHVFHKAYEAILKDEEAHRLDIDHYITFLVERRGDEDLIVSWHVAPLKGDATEVVRKLLEVFPKGLTQYRPDT